MVITKKSGAKIALVHLCTLALALTAAVVGTCKGKRVHLLIRSVFCFSLVTVKKKKEKEKTN